MNNEKELDLLIDADCPECCDVCGEDVEPYEICERCGWQCDSIIDGYSYANGETLYDAITRWKANSNN